MINTIIQKEILNNKEYVAVRTYLGQKDNRDSYHKKLNKTRYLDYHHGNPKPQNQNFLATPGSPTWLANKREFKISKKPNLN
jgi:hypothetical protein